MVSASEREILDILAALDLSRRMALIANHTALYAHLTGAESVYQALLKGTVPEVVQSSIQDVGGLSPEQRDALRVLVPNLPEVK